MEHAARALHWSTDPLCSRSQDDVSTTQTPQAAKSLRPALSAYTIPRLPHSQEMAIRACQECTAAASPARVVRRGSSYVPRPQQRQASLSGVIRPLERPARPRHPRIARSSASWCARPADRSIPTSAVGALPGNATIRGNRSGSRSTEGPCPNAWDPTASPPSRSSAPSPFWRTGSG